jgi:hypothetical protein
MSDDRPPSATGPTPPEASLGSQTDGSGPKGTTPNANPGWPELWLWASGSTFSVVAIGIWVYSTKSLAADYIPLLLVFISAIAGIAGKSWDESRTGFSRITLKGRILIALALLGLVVGIRTTKLTHTKLKEAGQIQKLAYSQLIEGVSMILFPITSSWRDPPKNDIAILARAREKATVDALAKTRVVPFADTAEDIMMMTEDSRMFGLTANGTQIQSSCGSPHSGFRALHELFDFCINGGQAKIKETEQIFLSDFDPETIKLVQDVLEDKFYESRYKNLSQHNDLFFQGLYDESGESRKPPADRAWRGLLEVERTLLPRRDNLARKKGPISQWLYLGTYYFGQNSDIAPYRSFLQKIDALVRRVDSILHSSHLIDTF